MISSGQLLVSRVTGQVRYHDGLLVEFASDSARGFRVGFLVPGNARWRAALRATFPLASCGWKTGQRFLDLKLPQMMVQMLIHQRRPFQRSQRSEKEVRMLRAYRRPTRRKAVDEFA